MRYGIGLLGAAVFGLFVPMFAHATLTVTPITWNVVGLDSNSPTAGPKDFPVGARVCSNVATTNVAVTWFWDSTNANVNLRPGSLSTLTLASIGAGACADAYFEIEVNQVVAAYDTTRRYHITAADGSGTVSTPTPREVYVEHLISQNRNSITGIKLNGVSVPAGGSMNLVVGNTYTIELDGGTATQGYNQFEAFISFPNTIFQILSVSTTYSADNSPYVPGPAPIASDKLYADACLWESNPTSPNYRSCIGGDYKAGGSTVVTTYTIKVISGGGTAQTLNSLLYDFSGSSYHYNSDFGVNAVIANIIDPTAVTISKTFSPSPAVAGGTSTLTFVVSNPNSAAVSGASFSDPLPLLSGSQMTVATPATFSASGCGSPTFAPTAGASSISFSNGSVAANSTCVVSVQVALPSAPSSGTYTNTSNDLFVGGIDSGHFSTASLPLTSATVGAGLCGVTLASWTVPNGTAANPPDLAGGLPTTKAADVSTATASANVPASTAIIASSGHGDTTSWETFGYKTGGNYIQFVVDTSKYTKVQMSFWVADPSPSNGPQAPGGVVLAYSTGGSFTTATTFDPSTAGTGFVQHTFDFTGLTNTSGNTTFRLTATDAKNDNSGASLNYDDISFSGCGTPTQPTLTKTFAPNPVAVNGTSTLTFTLSNPNSVQLTGAKFLDTLPSGLQVASTPSASTTCTGSPTWAPSGGSTSLAFGQATGANIPASGSCTASVSVKATTAGPHTNVSGFISTTEGGTNSGSTGSATASLTAIVPPTIAKAFGTDPILVNGTSLLTFTITNPNASDTLTGIAFADTYPSGLVNVSPLSPPVANTCGGSVVAAAGGNSISLSGGTLAGGASCTVSVTVTAAAAATYSNTSGAVSATTAGTGNTASASLTVNATHPAISVLKQVGSSATGPWFAFLSVAPTTHLYYRFTVENTGDVALNPFSVSDPTLAGTAADPAGCVWTTTNSPSTLPVLPVASATVDPTATCVVGPISAANGDNPNTATAHGTNSATVYNSSPASADYFGATPGFSLLKQIGTSADGPWSSTINVAAGDNVFYKFTLVNTGNVSLSSISVTDPLLSVTDPLGMASCTFTDPLPVDSATTCIVGPVVASGTASSTTTNTATGHGTNSGTVYDTAPSSASYTIGASISDLAITKNDGVTSVNAGGSTIYTIVATNNGPSAVTGATVTDTAPTGLTIGAWTCAASVGSSCPASGSGSISASVNLLNAGTATFTVNATVAGSATGSIANTASVAVPSGVTDPTPGNNSATDTDTVNLVADLSITKTDGVTSVVPGTSTTYTIVVTNNGPSSVTGATVGDVLPAAVTSDTFTAVASGSASGFTASGSGNISDTVNMPAGSTITYTVVANIGAGATGSLSNTASVTAPLGVSDPDPTNNSATDTDTLTAQADLGITKTDGVTSVVAGGSTTYTIVVSNNGPSSVTGATVSDSLPAAVASDTFTAVASGGASGFTASGSGNINNTVNMPVGSTITYTVVASIGAGATGSVVNTATVTVPAGVTDPTPGNNTATDTDTITPAAVTADLAITKDDALPSVLAGGSTAYTIMVSNAGPSSADGAVLTDPAVANLNVTSVACSTAGGGAACPSVANATVALLQGVGIVIPTLPSGGSVSFTVNATVASGATGTISNTAHIAAPAGVTDPNLANNTATDTDPVFSQVLLDVVKTDGSATYTPGGTATYTVTVTAIGPSDASNVTVSDALPSGVTLTANVNCVANGNSSCGTVTGSNGGTSFGATGASIAAGMGNSLVFAVSVAFDSGMTTDPLVNTATATDLATSATASGTDTDSLLPQVTLAVAKTDGSLTYTPGGTATYSVTVTNGGLSDATFVVVSDTLPTGVTLTASATCVANGNASCGTVTGVAGETSFLMTVGSIAAGPGNSLVLTAPVAFAAGLTTDPLVNTAIATDFLAGAFGSDSDSDARSAQVSLAVLKTDGSTTYTPGSTATYTITVTDTGVTDALDVSVDDTLPTGVTLSGTVTCTPNGSATCGTVTGSLGQTSFSATGATIASGGGNSLVFTVPVAFASDLADDPLANTATANDLVSSASGSDSDSDVLSAQADLSITKTDGVTSVTAGGTTTYTIVVTNNGPSDVIGAAVADLLPAAITSDAFTAVQSGGASGFSASGSGNINDTVDMPAGSTITYTVVANVSASATGSMSNTATVSAPAGVTDSNPGNNSDTDTDTVTPATVTADLAITKTDGVTSVIAGGTTTYTIVVTNNGPGDVSGATVTDLLPAAVTSDTFTAVQSGGASGFTASGSGNINDTVNLPAASKITYTVVANISSGATGSMSNTASVTAPSGVADPTPGNNSSTDTDTVTSTGVTADLSIAKTDGVTSVNAGGSTIYTIIATNNGPSAVTAATVTDTAPTGLTVGAWTCAASAGSSCPASGSGNISASVNLLNGGTATFTVNATVAGNASGSIANTASVAVPSGVTDPTPGNNSSTDTDTVNLVADLSITKTDGVTSVNAGGSTIYSIVATNNGPSAVTAATVTDTAPTNLTIGSWTCAASAGSSCPASGSGNISASVNLLNAGTATFTVNATVASNATGSIANTATIAAPIGVTDPTPGNNSATDTDTVAVVANLAITKTDGRSTYTPGGTATYSITVTNSGPGDATSVTATDNLPAGLTLTAVPTCVAIGSAICGSISGTAGGTSFTATGATIAAGAGNRLVYSVPVLFSAILKASQITNTATAGAPAAPTIATASSTNTLGTTARAQPAQPVPVGDPRALWLLTCLILLLGGRRVRTRL